MDPAVFDSLSRDLTNGVPRRAILKSLAAACLSSFVGPIFGIRGARAQGCVDTDIVACINAANDQFDREVSDCNEVPHPAPCRAAAKRRHDAALKSCVPCTVGPGSCRITSTGDGFTRRYAVKGSAGTQALTLTVADSVPPATFHSAAGRTTFGNSLRAEQGKKTILLGTDLLLGLEYRLSSGSASVDVSFGTAFRGVKSSSCTFDGNMVHATVDGRAVVPFAPGTGPIAFRFADGMPPPAVDVAAQVLAGLKEILQQGSVIARSCRQSPSSAPHGEDNTHGSPGCTTCETACADTAQVALDLAAVVAIGCLFEAPACFAVAAAGIQVAYDGCRRGCEGPGAPCCPVPCDVGCCDNGHTCCGSEGACCQQGERCAGVRLGVGVCCPVNSGPVCGTFCCPSGQTCLDDARGICCPPGTQLCGDTCCPTTGACLNNSICCGANSKLCGGTCCPKDAPCIDGFCCQPPNHVCSGHCCAAFDVCCNNTCCGGDNLCIGGQICCPRDQMCGAICCPPGQHCVNGTCAVCPQGTVPCSSPGPNGVVTSVCCPAGANCCLGVCCTDQTGHECTGVNGACGTIH